MNFWSAMTGNYVINVGFIAWGSAQLLKTLLTYITTKKLELERLVGAGGMPSSHSALVCSLTIAIAKSVGLSSPIFALTLAFAAIVMYDAMGVRRAAGEQAKVLNKMRFDFKDLSEDLGNLFTFISKIEEDNEPAAEKVDQEDKALKEFIGHTPMEVLGGALLGILVATLMPQR